MMLIKIENNCYDICFNGATFREYRRVFGRDMLNDMFEIEKALNTDVIENVIWILLFQNGYDIPPLDEWLASLKSPFSLIVVWKDIYKEFVNSTKTLEKSKKKSKKRGRNRSRR